MKDRAYAKLNLALDVFNIRDDGYHDLRSIMVPINFYDELSIDVVSNDEYLCNRHYIRFNEKNSIIKMINAFKNKYNIDDHYKIILNKQIPTQAGLGGGTSDGASTLRILQRIYKKHLNDDEIKDFCLNIGADVLFNYYNKAALVSGIGDEIEIFNIKKDYFVLLIKPYAGISTKLAYTYLDMNKCDHPDVDELKRHLETGMSIDGLLGNSLEQPAFELNNDIKQIKTSIIENGAKNVLMSGSGSTVFMISEEYKEIERINDSLKNKKYFTRISKILR